MRYIGLNIWLEVWFEFLIILKRMRGGDKKLTHLEEIKKIEKNREERRIKMEEAKREKEERKVINAQSGKNVDIDFELMIEKSKFREKMLSPHASAIDLKVN